MSNHLFPKAEAVAQRCSVKRCSQKFRKIHRKTPVPKRLWHRCFSVNFPKFLRTPFIIEHLWWLPPQKAKCTSMTNFMKLPKKRILMNAFFKARFNYCPIVQMFHSRSLNNKINRFHEHCLRIIYNNERSHFEELLVKNNSL